ncbi:MAG: hypothetical protein JRN15_13800 [Nitrososphaerota archaeon]|jgi:hypothetical protein|nr:hypothetical protein [Nitrososphaerota archaeon]
MSSKTTKIRVNKIYNSAKQSMKRVANSHQAREIEARARKTMIRGRDGTKRIAGSQEVREKGNDVVRSAKDFLGAVYNAAHAGKSKKEHKTPIPLKSKTANRKMKRKNN